MLRLTKSEAVDVLEIMLGAEIRLYNNIESYGVSYDTKRVLIGISEKIAALDLAIEVLSKQENE